MILYVGKIQTKDDKEVIELLVSRFPNMTIAPSSGAGLPELVRQGVSFVGVEAIHRFLGDHHEKLLAQAVVNAPPCDEHGKDKCLYGCVHSRRDECEACALIAAKAVQRVLAEAPKAHQRSER